MIEAAERLGINYIDLYTPDPEVREALGTSLKGKREKFILQSHICSVWKDGQYKRSRDIDEVKEAMSDMLSLLKTDYIDVGMIHYVDSMEDWRTIAEGPVLKYVVNLKEKGIIKHIGLSSHNPEVALEAINTGHIEVLMFSVNPCYDLLPASEDVESLWDEKNYENHLVNMDPKRQELYETCQSLGVRVTVMKAFGGGGGKAAPLPAGHGVAADIGEAVLFRDGGDLLHHHPFDAAQVHQNGGLADLRPVSPRPVHRRLGADGHQDQITLGQGRLVQRTVNSAAQPGQHHGLLVQVDAIDGVAGPGFHTLGHRAPHQAQAHNSYPHACPSRPLTTEWSDSSLRARGSKVSGFSDWGPSHRACSGSLWTSICRPSAPAATAAMASGSTSQYFPVAWLGSTMMGRWVSLRRTGMAARSRVLRV